MASFWELAGEFIDGLFGGDQDPYISDIDLDGDGVSHFGFYHEDGVLPDGIAIDFDGDGNHEVIATFDGDISVDYDDDGSNDIMGYDTNGDGVQDTYYLDVDGDGNADVMLQDKDGDGTNDYYAVDLNGDGDPELEIYDRDGDGSLELDPNVMNLLDMAFDGDASFDVPSSDDADPFEPDSYENTYDDMDDLVDAPDNSADDMDNLVDDVPDYDNTDDTVPTSDEMQGYSLDTDSIPTTDEFTFAAPGSDVNNAVAYDTDGDGVADTYYYDYHGNDGVIDTAAFDTNGDGLLDTYAWDTDGDGQMDLVGFDTDGDNIQDTYVTDDNGDGVFELPADGDYTVVPDENVPQDDSPYEPTSDDISPTVIEEGDSNGDGYTDVIGVDTNGDGKIDAIGVDLDFDGVVDAEIRDLDFDGTADVIYTDADGDGNIEESDISGEGLGMDETYDAFASPDQPEEPAPGGSTVIEEGDSNGDGYTDVIGVDTNGDGKIDAVGVDLDFDGVVDAEIRDLDFDGTADVIYTDVDGDGNIEESDISGEGLGMDETYDAFASPDQPVQPEEPTPTLVDEADSNNDGYTDVVAVDTNGDGRTDVVTVDLDYNGTADAEIRDLDFDGTADVMVIDNDGDGNIDETIDISADGIGMDETFNAFASPDQPVQPEEPPVNEDGFTVVDQADTNGDGAADVIAADLDGNGTIDAIAVDGDHDGVINAMIVDSDGDGKADTIFYDSDQDGEIDYSETVESNISMEETYQNLTQNPGVEPSDPEGPNDDGYQTHDIRNDGHMKDIINNAFEKDEYDYVTYEKTGERFFADTDGDGQVDTMIRHFDSDGDGIADTTVQYYDIDGDGSADEMITTKLIDTDGDGVFDTYQEGFDADNDGVFDEVRVYDYDETDGSKDFIEMYTDIDASDYDFDADYFDATETFDPNDCDPSKVVGDPASAMEHWEFQGNTGRCGIFAQLFIIEEYTGQEIDIEDLVDQAEAHGWFWENPADPSECSGTSAADTAKLLELYGVPCEQSYGNDLSDIREALEDGKHVIVGIDADEIWGQDTDDIFSPSDGVNHAVDVIGIDYSDPDNPMVILNDSGSRGGCGELVPVDVFMDAWDDSNYELVVAG